MKKLFICIILISIYSCSSSKNSSSTVSADSNVTTTASTDGKDGSTIEKAIVIKAANESAGVGKEYAILAKMFPGYSMISQGTSSKGSRYYDIMRILTSDKVEKVVYFDITGFYGKF